MITCLAVAAAARICSGSPILSSLWLSSDVGPSPSGVAVGDVNGDGRLDAMTSNYNDGTVSLLLGKNDGTYEDQRITSGFSLPRCIAAVDLNADGQADALVGNESAVLSVLMGGGGGLTSGATAPVAGRSFSIATGDLNGDGQQDAVVACYDGGVTVLLGDGSGGFTTRTDLATGGFAYSVAVGDVNGDHLRDIVSTTSQNRLAILPGNGGGAFGARIDVPLPYRDHDVTTGDLDGDGRDEIVVTADLANMAAVVGRNADGTFSVHAQYPVRANPIGVRLCRLDSDGNLDLVVCHSSSSSTSILPGNGDGTFGTRRDIPAGLSDGVETADVNSDGHTDILLAQANSGLRGVVATLLGNGDGSLGHDAQYPTGGVSAGSAAVADLDGDGWLDVVTGNIGSSPALGGISVLRNAGNGTLVPAHDYRYGHWGYVAVGDVDGDGHPDAASTDSQRGTVFVLRGDGTGGFGAPTEYPAGVNPAGHVIADLNGDGRGDLVVADVGTLQVWDGAIAVMLTGTGGSPGPPVIYPAGPYTSSVTVGDLDGDGAPDVVACNGNGMSNSITVYLGSPDGTLGQRRDVAVGGNPVQAAIGDLNGDGKADVVVANDSQNSVSVLLGDGHGAFGPQVQYPTSDGPFSVAIGDLDADGRPDLVVANAPVSTISVLLGRHDGIFGFEPKTDYGSGRIPIAVAIADMNADGKPDVVAANQSANTVSVLVNTSQDIPTATLLEFFTVDWAPAGARLQWRLASAVGERIVLERSMAGTAFWSEVDGDPQDGDEGSTLIDPQADPHHAYLYRLSVASTGGTSQILGTVELRPHAIAPAGIELSPVQPNPAAGDVAIDFTLPRDAPVRISVIDVAGREVERVADTPFAAGQHRLTWHPGPSRAAGVYQVIIEAAAQRVRRTFIRLK